MADWKLDKHQAVLKFNPSRMLADHRPNRILVHRQLTRRHLGVEHFRKIRAFNRKTKETMEKLSTGLIRDAQLIWLLCFFMCVCFFFFFLRLFEVNISEVSK